MGKMNKLYRIGTGTGLALLSTFLCLIILEIALRLIGLKPGYIHKYSWKKNMSVN